MKHSALLLLVVVVSSPAFAGEPPQPAISSRAAAALPPAGRLLSFHATDPDGREALVIARATRTGLVTLSRTPRTLASSEAWLDQQRLVVVGGADLGNTSATLTYFVEGAIDQTRSRSVALDWELRKGEQLAGVQTFSGSRGAIWLRGCLAEWEYGDDDCKQATWMRIDGARPARARRTPANLRAMGTNPFPIPTIKAPARHVVKVAKVTVGNDERVGVECKTPTASGSWSIDSAVEGELFRARKVAWVMETPAIFAVTGRSETAGGVSTTTHYGRACAATKMDWFGTFGGGLWAEQVADTLTLSIGADAIAVMNGQDLLLAP